MPFQKEGVYVWYVLKGLSEKIREYCRLSSDKFYSCEENVVCEEIRRIVADTISKRDKRIIGGSSDRHLEAVRKKMQCYVRLVSYGSRG